MDRTYAVQVTTYALAALRTGAPAVEVAYAFLERADAVATRRFEAGGARPDARGRAPGGDRGHPRGRFPAGPGFQCRECPALDLLCAGPGLEWQG